MKDEEEKVLRTLANIEVDNKESIKLKLKEQLMALHSLSVSSCPWVQLYNVKS